MRSREGRRRWFVASAAAAASTLWWSLWIATSSPSALIIAVVIQVVGAVLVSTVLAPRRGGLALAVGLSVPAVGPLAALATTVAGRGGRELIHDPHKKPRPRDAREIVRSLSGAVPAWEAVVSSNPDVRRSALSALSLRANACDLEVLRWARVRSSGEIGLEVALAFDEASQVFEHRAALARAAAKDDRSYVVAAHAFRVLVEGIRIGIVDPPAISRIAAEARRYHDAAVAADSVRARELLVDRAELELADRCPISALDVLRPVISAGEPPNELTILYQQAAYAARRFDLTLSTRSKALVG
jgi:hypothetical protein